MIVHLIHVKRHGCYGSYRSIIYIVSETLSQTGCGSVNGLGNQKVGFLILIGWLLFVKSQIFSHINLDYVYVHDDGVIRIEGKGT